MTYALPLNLGETVIGHVSHPPAAPIPLPAPARIRSRAAILNCTACELHAGCQRPVPWEGPAPNRVLVIGEAPGIDEDRAGVPFVGKSGQLLRRALSAVGFAPWGPNAGNTNLVTFANTVSCRPALNPPTPRKEHIEACAAHLARQIKAVAPDHVLLVGAIALTRFRPDLRITGARGRPFTVPHPAAVASQGGALWCYPVVHPASILRDRSQEPSWREDLERWAQMVLGDRPPTDWLPVTCAACRQTVDRYDPDGVAWCAAHHPRGTAGWQASTKKRTWMFRTEMLASGPLDMVVPEPKIANPT